MISKHQHKKLTWIDLENPSKSEVLSLVEEYKIHPLIANELLETSDRSKVDVYEDCMYLILHFPKYGHRDNDILIQEVDFIIGKDFLITTHYETVDPLLEFSKIFESNSILNKGSMDTHAGFLFYFIMRKMYEYTEYELEHVSNKLKEAEKKIFTGYNEKNMVEEMSVISKEIIDLRKAVKSHDEILASYQEAAKMFFGYKYGFYITAISGEYNKIWNSLDSMKEVLSDLKETNDSLFSAKANEIMKNLTIMAFFTLPLSLLASIFGMGAKYTPFFGRQDDFWIVISIMIAATVLTFLFFKLKKWI